MKNRITLIVSTYNQPRYLSVSLRSVLHQSLLPDEIIVADDGSDSATEEVVDKFRQQTSITVKHIWRQHDGFRKAVIMNKAIAASSSDYIIQIDGDIILHRDFIADHMRIARKGWLSCGTRVMLTRAATDSLLSGERNGIPQSVRFTTINAMRNRLIFPLWTKRYRSTDRLRMSHGCNCAFWRDDLLKINGYNEDFVGWGYEDTDLIVRLENTGIRRQIIKFGAVEYHLDHPHNSRVNISTNFALLGKAIKERHTRCSNGLDNHAYNRLLRVAEG